MEEYRALTEEQQNRYDTMRAAGNSHSGAINHSKRDPKDVEKSPEVITAREVFGKWMGTSKTTGLPYIDLPAQWPTELAKAVRQLSQNQLRQIRNSSNLNMSIRTSNALKRIYEEMRRNGTKGIVEEVLLELKASTSHNAAMDKIKKNGSGRGVGSGAVKPSESRQGNHGGIKKRIIRTEAGAKRYNGNIGDPIGKSKIKKGETLSELAEKYYGDASKWKLIAKASGIKDPKKIPVGTELTFPPDPDAPKGKGKGKATGTSKRKTGTGKGSSSGSGSSVADAAREDHKTYDDKDSVDLEGTFYAEKNMTGKDILEKFYKGDKAKYEEFLKVNGLKEGETIPEGFALILPGIRAEDVYPDKKKQDSVKKRANEKTLKNAPAKAPSGAPRKAASHGYVIYSDGSVHGPNGWIIRKPKKSDKKK